MCVCGGGGGGGRRGEKTKYTDRITRLLFMPGPGSVVFGGGGGGEEGGRGRGEVATERCRRLTHCNKTNEAF